MPTPVGGSVDGSYQRFGREIVFAARKVREKVKIGRRGLSHSFECLPVKLEAVGSYADIQDRCRGKGKI